MRNAKIVCTIGPASDQPAMLDRLIEAGLDAARLNFSHGRHESQGLAVKAIREAATRPPACRHPARRLVAAAYQRWPQKPS